MNQTPYSRHPKSSQYLVSRCWEPLNAFSGDDLGVETPITRYLRLFEFIPPGMAGIRMGI